MYNKHMNNSLTRQALVLKLIPVMLAFFAMSFVDSVGTATNYVKESFHLSNTVANLCPLMVFFWFLVCSVPTGILMNKIGRRKTVLLSLIITLIALILPLVHYSFASMMVVFALLGISNAIMQVSLNPLLSNLVSEDKLASMMTFGQFVKAICSFVAPIVAAWFAARYQNWVWLYGVFAVEGFIALLTLSCTEIKENQTVLKTSGIKETFVLLGDGTIFLFFVGIMCHVGIDVGTNTAGPQILMERLDWPLSRAIYASSIYFMFRTIGCFLGAFLLAKFSAKKIFLISVLFMLSAMVGLFIFRTQWPLYVCVAFIGLGNANMFPIIFSQALLSKPQYQNETSALMIMGLIGGAVFPLCMGISSDLLGGQIGSVMVLTLCVGYLLFLVRKVRAAA